MLDPDDGARRAGLPLSAPTQPLARRSSPRRRRGPAVLLSLATTLLAIFVAERALKAWDQYRFSRLTDYGDTWRKDGLGPGGYLLASFTSDVVGENGHLVRWQTNAQGLRYERDLSPARPADVHRVLVLGDSFAAGYRTDQAETFAARAEAELRRRGWQIEMPIAVIEEPVTGLYWLQQNGLDLAPDGVLLTICLCNDIAQAFQGLHERGPYELTLAEPVAIRPRQASDPIGFHHGLEGFDLPRAALIDDPPTRVRAPFRLRLLRPFLGEPRRALRPSYGGGQPHKLFDPGTGFGFCLRDPPPEIETAFARLALALTGYQRLCAQRGIRFMVLLAPQSWQVQDIDWRLAVETYGLRESAFDRARANDRIRSACNELGVPCIDPTAAMRARHEATGEELHFLGGDMHWVSAGHRVVAECVVAGLEAALR